jgi:dimethylaniline monooxygenase (N-oxide forming)
MSHLDLPNPDLMQKLPDPIYNGQVEAYEEDIRRNGVAPPTDTGFASLFDTAYVHPALSRARWTWDYYDAFTWFYSWLTTGAGTGIDQFAGEVRGERHHAMFGRLPRMSRWSAAHCCYPAVANKSNKTQVYISDPYRPKPGMIERLRARMISLPKVNTQNRQIDLAPWPDHIDADGRLHFQNNGRPEYYTMKDVVVKPDLLIYATGYTQVFPFFDESYPTIFDADVRRVWKSGVHDVGFIGFARPAFGMFMLPERKLWCDRVVSPCPSQV